MLKETHFQIKGMSQDLAYQVFNSQYAFECKNIRINTTDKNSLLSISNEKGNTEVATIEYKGDAVTIIGVGQFSEYCVLFGTTGKEDVILLVRQVEEEGVITEQVEQVYDGNLEFDIKHPIRTVCVYENEQMQKVYWIDGKNPPRVLNIAGHLKNEDGTPKYLEVKKIEEQKIDFLPKLKFEEKVTISRTSGGLFPAGVIQYAFTYSDRGLQESNLWYVSPLYYITQTNKGAEAGTTCNVAFKLDFTGLDKSFDYMQIYAIVRTSLNAAPACYKIANIPTTTTTFTDTGSQWEACSADIILGKQLGTFIPNVIASKDSTLFLGNYILESPLVSRNKYVDFFNTLSNNTRVHFKTKLPNTATGLENGSKALQTFRSGEYYRIGLQFQDEYGTPSNVVYLKDIQPDVADIESGEFMQKIIKSQIPSSVPEDLKKYKRVRLLMVDRTNLPHRTLCQGILCPTVYRLNDRVNNSPFAMNSWCMRGFDATLDERPTWEPDTPLKSNLKAGGAEILSQTEIDKNFIIVNPEIKENVENYYLMHIRVSRDISSSYAFDNTIKFTCKLYKTSDANITSISEAKSNGTKLVDYTFYFYEVNAIPIPSNASFRADREAEVKRALEKDGASYPEKLTYDLFRNWNSIEFYEAFNNDKKLPYIDLAGTDGVPEKTSDGTAQSFEDAIEFSKYKGQPFFCDHNIITFHSPDVEKYQAIIDNNSKLKYRIVGYTDIESSYFDYFIQSSKPNSSSDNDGQQTVGKASKAGIYNSAIWKDSKFYQIYIWHRDMALGNQGTADEGVWYGSYTKKIMSNVHKCGPSYAFKYSDGKIAIIEPVTKMHNMYPLDKIQPRFPEMGTPRVFNFDEITALQLERQNNSRSIHDKLIYYGNVDILHIGTTYKSIINEEGTLKESTSLSDTCHISYKSSPHVVLPMSYFTSGEVSTNTFTVFAPSLPYPTNDGTGITSIDVDGTGYIWSTSPHGYERDFLSNIPIESNDKCLLYIAELYQNLSAEDIYGATDEESLSKYSWLPISDWVDLQEDNNTLEGYGDCFIGRWECLKSYAFSKDSQQSYIDITSIILESDTNLESRYDSYKGVQSAYAIDASKFNLFNPIYNQQNNLFSYRALTSAESINNFQNQICWSEVKTLGEELDTWCQINVGNNTDLQGEYGELNGMITSNNSLYCFQDNAVYKINYNTRVTISPSDGVPIQLTNNYRMDPPLLLRTDCGVHSQDCLAKSSNSVYFFDKRRKRLFAMGKDDNIIDLSGAKGITSLVHSSEEFNNILYDPNVNDIYFNFGDKSICYNEDIAEFTSLYDYYTASHIFCLGDDTYISKDNGIYKQRSGAYNVFFGQKKPYYIELLANDNPTISKTFTNVEFNIDPINLKGAEETFDLVSAETSYQEGSEVLKVNKIKPSNMKRKFRIWRINLPRESGSMNRLRDRWCKIKLQNTNPSGVGVKLNYINVSYIPD